MPMKRSLHIALAGCAALLGSTAVSSAAPAVVPQGVVVSAIAQSDLNAILREIQKGTPVAQVLARYDLTAADLQRLGIDVARVMDRLEKHAERTAKPRPGDDEDDTTRTRGASRPESRRPPAR